MKKAVFVVLIVALFTLALAGCGGGATEETSEPASETQAAPAATSTTTTSDSSSAMSSQAKVPRTFTFSKNTLPQAFVKALKDSEITVVAFYDPDDSTSNKMRIIIEEVLDKPDYDDQVKYLSYEINKKATAAVAKLTTVLGAKLLPHIFIIDRDRNIVFEDSGYTDQDYFEHAVFNVVYKDSSPAAKSN